MNRRRFLSLSAAFTCAPALAQASTWSGTALGAEVSVTLHGPRERTAPLLAAVPTRLRAIEAQFSLYQPSALTRLNETGQLVLSPEFAELTALCDRAHLLTGGLFDPTVQTLWHAAETGTRADPKTIGWHQTRRTGNTLHLGSGQQITLNGIAQGYATDLIRTDLIHAGATKALINIGEFAALSGPFHLGLSDPQHGLVGQTTLTDGAVATSSPTGTLIAGQPHIMGPAGQRPLWSTVSITADSAAMADALSTAACMMPLHDLRTLKQSANLRRIQIVDTDGNLITL
ncbi:FAD:protein FMN transferase [Pararhodobacter marinus]|uniref:FAD:protein FMN transferase n=1 Tax=Pararhodobacter marinus TaxID=2184063 RepID=UPI0035118AED